MLPATELTRHTPESQVADWVDHLKQSPGGGHSLAKLLPERHPLYENRSTNEIIRIRGYVMAAFEETGLVDEAVPYILEELQNGRNAYLVAGAAKALRGVAEPTSQTLPFLLAAVANIKYMDDAVTFEKYRPQWPIESPTTALQELFKTVGSMGGAAHGALNDLEVMSQDSAGFSEATRKNISMAVTTIRGSKNVGPATCCGSAERASLPQKTFAEHEGGRVPLDVTFEDQDGRLLTYEDWFCQTASIVAFFYSRCDNPNKCSLTVTKLAKLQQALRAEGLSEQIRTAAITYDPAYDLPPRLRAYGENRGVTFDGNNRFLRTKGRFEEVQDYFKLGVNFNYSIVNWHRIELFVLNGRGEVTSAFSRLQWDIGDVIRNAVALI